MLAGKFLVSLTLGLTSGSSTGDYRINTMKMVKKLDLDQEGMKRTKSVSQHGGKVVLGSRMLLYT